MYYDYICEYTTESSSSDISQTSFIFSSEKNLKPGDHSGFNWCAILIDSMWSLDMNSKNDSLLFSYEYIQNHSIHKIADISDYKGVQRINPYRKLTSEEILHLSKNEDNFGEAWSLEEIENDYFLKI